MNKKKLAAMALIPTLGVAALGTYAFAANASTTTTSSTARPPHEGRGNRDNTLFANDLAVALNLNAADIKSKLDTGITQDDIIIAAGSTKDTVTATIKTAHEASMKAKISEKVAAGTITQAQVDEMITRMANNKGTPKEHGPGGHGKFNSAAFAANLAQLLGLTSTDVKAKLDAGTKPDDIITAAGKNAADVMTQLKALMEVNMKVKLTSDVTAGTITQAQADTMVAQNGKGPRSGHGPRGAQTTTSTQ